LRQMIPILPKALHSTERCNFVCGI
jgi:hypothetical protein